MPNLKLQKGFIHLGIIVFVLVGLTVATTIAINASPLTKGRRLSTPDILCKIKHPQENCQQSVNQQTGTQQSNGSSSSSSGTGNNTSSNQSASESFTPSRNGPCFPLGDAYKDSVSGITDKDAQIILDHSAGNYTYSSLWNALGADVNGDGQINPVDAQLIRQYLAGQINTFASCDLIIDQKAIKKGTIANPTKPVPCGFYGDVSDEENRIGHDGKIGLLDVRQAYNMSASTGGVSIWADVNHDGKVDPRDAKLILQYVKGEISTFPACSATTAGTTFNLWASKGQGKMTFHWSGGSIPAGPSYTFKVWRGDCNQENSTVYPGLVDYVKQNKYINNPKSAFGNGLPTLSNLPWPPKTPVSTLFYNSSVTRTPSGQLIGGGFGFATRDYCAGIYNSSSTLLSNAFYFTF